MTDTHPKIMVVLPTYNEKENLPNMVEALFGLGLPNLHVLVVDDNSPDGTGDIAENLAGLDTYVGHIAVLHREQKEGLGPAYKAGFKKALSLGADLIVQMDCDFSHQPKYIPQMLELLKGSDIVVGSRYMKGGSVDEKWGPIRKLLSWWANRIYTPTILGIPVKDATGGYRAYHRDVLMGMGVDRVRASGYVFQVELIFVALKLGYSVKELAIHFPDRVLGTSKMSPAIALEAAVRVWQIKFRHRSLNPSHRQMEETTTSS